MNKDMKRIMFEMMEESIDDVVTNGGFIRRHNSLIYSKNRYYKAENYNAF